MSSNLGLNTLISWKTQSFNQITSSIRKNGTVNANISVGTNIFNKHGGPLKIFRREIVVPTENSCNQHSLRIDILNTPGSNITNSSVTNNTGGLVNTADFKLINEPSNYTCTENCASVGNTQSNALRRLRSSGMIKKQFDLSTQKPAYYTNSQQYLAGRNLGFNQNQYYYTRIGNTSAKPGDSLTTNNMYTNNSTANCTKFYIASETSFQYTWVNRTDPPATATVTIPVGYYTIDDLNNILYNTMIANDHYYFRNNNNTKVCLMSFALNGSTGNIELTISPISTSIAIANDYQKALVVTEGGNVPTSDWDTPATATTPQIIILNNAFKDIIGFAPGTYPPNGTTTATTTVSTSPPAMTPSGQRVYYKPNNPQFAQQGAVTSSSKIARKRYDTIINSASSYTNAFGLHVANALAYGVPANGYTIKDKIGYPNKSTPVVTTTGEMRFCK